jgi:hypothetical protein
MAFLDLPNGALDFARLVAHRERFNGRSAQNVQRRYNPGYLRVWTGSSSAQMENTHLGMNLMNPRASSIRKISFGLVLLGLLALAQPSSSEDKPAHHETMQACAKACSDCQRECDMCTMHCSTLLAEGQKEHVTPLRSCQDCATICAAAAQIVARVGPYSGLICESCAKACDHCAKACDKFPKDAHMKRCAEECRKCQKACEEMAKSMLKL